MTTGCSWVLKGGKWTFADTGAPVSARDPDAYASGEPVYVYGDYVRSDLATGVTGVTRYWLDGKPVSREDWLAYKGGSTETPADLIRSQTVDSISAELGEGCDESPHTIDSLLAEDEELREELACYKGLNDKAWAESLRADLAALLAMREVALASTTERADGIKKAKPAISGIGIGPTDQKYRGLGYCAE